MTLLKKLLVLCAAIVAVTIANNVVLLRLHPLEYYYTPAGLMITTIVMAVEGCVALAAMKLWVLRGEK